MEKSNLFLVSLTEQRMEASAISGLIIHLLESGSDKNPTIPARMLTVKL